MAYKFQFGPARLSGSTTFEEAVTVASLDAGSGDIDTSGDLTAGTITMTGFAVDADGDASVKSLKVDDDSTIGTDSDADMILLDPGADITIAADLDFIIAKAGGLQLADGAVNSTAAELNLLDGSSAGTVVNSKAVIYSAAGVVQGTDFKGPNGFDIGNADNADAMKFNASEIIVKDGVDFSVATVGGFNYGGAAVTSTAAELNLLDTAVAGTVVNSKAVVYSSSGSLNAHGMRIPDGAYDLDIASHDGSNGLKLAGTLVTADAGELNLLDTAVAGTAIASKAAIYDAQKGLTAHSLTSSFASLGAATGTTISGSGQVSAGGGLYADGNVRLNVAAAAVAQAADEILILDADDNLVKRESVTDFLGAIDGKGLKVESSQLASDVADDAGLSNDIGGGAKLGIDFNNIADAAVDITADNIAFDDGGTGLIRKEALADLIAAMAGPGLTQNSSTKKLEVSSNAVSEAVNGTILSEGYNYLTGTLAGAMTVSLPGSPTAGDVVTVKAAAGLSDSLTVTIATSGSHAVDGQDTVVLESPYAAVTCVYVASNDWRVV